MDPKDQILQGESAETPTVSPTETITPDNPTEVNPKGAEGSVSAEEEKWSSLGGAAQERFRQVTRENNALRQRLEGLEAKVNQSQSYYQPVNKVNPTPEVEDAVRKLDDVGIATKDYANQVVDQKLSGLLYKMELDRLGKKYDGSNGLPQFDKDEYEDFVARNPKYRNYDPEDVYQKMYEPEVLNSKLQGNQSSSATPVPSLKPTKTVVREESLTPESIEQRLKEPDGRAWYEKNFEKVNAVLQKNATQAW